MSTKAWTISELDFPRMATIAEQLQFLLRYAILAPSGHNSQPWLFRIQGETLELHADRSRALPVVDPQDRELIISCGAALFNLRVALWHFGYTDRVKLFPDPANPDWLACLSAGSWKTATPEEEALFQAILQRHTNRQIFTGQPVPLPLLLPLHTAANQEGGGLELVLDGEEQAKIAGLIAEGDRLQMANAHFRRELAAWIHANRSRSRDGMPGYAHGIGDLLSYASPLVIRTFDLGNAQAAKDQELARHSPALAILYTDEDTPQDWLAAGQALERVLLQAQASGLAVSYLNQPIEVPHLRTQLTQILGRSTFPQLLLRLGYGTAVKPTPRREVQEVLLD
ncbi:nitroreductase [Leptolyngbya sp. 'hensonii']|uniref:Acg family FMN-binding oxidoreductase n=1 Tax=Leptolyngbya sp. 'hensonii' TaxID=1922337 RepID=UPI00094FF7E1|nr:nitroreductase family protein [Leptolyngbya sp. 'hensonii']OLP17624.1 nitroreductase [Leptolyngbya sp. 'hensonii']